MHRAPTMPTTVTRVSSAGAEPRAERVSDQLIVEEPLTILLDGHLVATTMRTPGHDFELAAGLCFTDGLLAGAPVTAVRYATDLDELPAGRRSSSATGELDGSNAVIVETDGAAPVPRPRLGNVSSSCGWCGSDQIDDLSLRLRSLDDQVAIDVSILMRVSASVASLQPLFDVTGAVHGAAAFDRDGRIVIAREDVGRHNAVDKLIGALLLDGERLPAHGLGLFVSGRASIEMVQKAWAGGFATVLAVSGPTSLAVEAARRAGITLVGFAREDGCNIYTTPTDTGER